MHVNQYYFKKIEKPELERIDYLINLLSPELKGIAICYCLFHLLLILKLFLDKFELPCDLHSKFLEIRAFIFKKIHLI